MNPILNAHTIENKLWMLPNGTCIARWNDTFDIELLEGSMVTGSRRILASGSHIDTVLFARAHVRLAELRAKGVVKS